MPVKSAVITEAATGIGLALAQKLDRAGWRVFGGFNKTPPGELLHGVSERLTALPLSITSEVQIDKAIRTVERAAGVDGLQLLFNNAAMTAAPGPLETLDIEAFKQTMELNFWGPLRITQALLPLLRWGAPSRIIIVISASVYLTIPLGSSHPISQQALAALARHLRIELAPFGIEVTALAASAVGAPMTLAPAEEEAALWSSIPAPLREPYDAAFTHPGRVIREIFATGPPASLADKVYERIICARRLKRRYTLGKGVTLLPAMHRFLPDQALEYLFRKLFRVKRKPPDSSSYEP